MLTRPLTLLAAVCLYSTTTLACGPSETLLGTHRYALTADASLLLRVEQNGTDLVIAVDSDAGTTLYNHPNDRSAFELVYLRGKDGATQEVCVHSAFRKPDIRTQYEIVELDASTLAFAPLERFHNAARLWASGTPTARAEARGEYVALSALDPLEFAFRDLAGLYAIRAELEDSKVESALSRIEGFAPQADALANMPHVLTWYRGMALLHQRALASAVDVLREALALAPPSLDKADIRNLVGEALVGLNRVSEGEVELQAALAEGGSDHSLLAHIHNNLGYVLLRRAYAPGIDPADAERFLRASIDEHLVARAFAVNAADTVEQQSIDNNLGTLYERTRELRKAHYHYREALRLNDTAADPFLLGVLYMNLGALNQRIGDYPKSRGYLEQSLRIAKQTDSPYMTKTNCLLGTTYRLLGDIEQALPIHETCRSLAAAAPNYTALIEALAEISEDHLQAARIAGATPQQSDAGITAAWLAIGNARNLVAEHLPDLLEVGRASPIDPHSVNLCTAQRASATASTATLNEQELYLAANVLTRYALLAQRFAPENALDDLALAAGIIGTARYSGQLDILAAALQVYRAQGNSAFARACGEQAVTLSERLHEDLEAERNGPAWTAKTHEIYVALADMLLADASDTSGIVVNAELARDAFAVAESAMGISLRQHLSLPAADGRESEDARLRTALNTIADEHAALSAEQKAQLLPVSYYHQQDLVELSRLREEERVAIPPALGSEQVQAQLRDGQTVLYYYVGAGEAWLFELGASAFVPHQLGSAAVLAGLLANVDQDLRSANGRPTEGLRSLSAFLLPETLQLDGVSELLIVPHRDLYKIPFAALSRAANANLPLVEEFALKTTPSLSAYFMDKALPTDAHSADIAVFADPLFNTEDLRGAATGLAVEEADMQRWSAGLERLPYTELEANSLKALFRPERTLDFLGNRATLDNLASDAARNARILHIATHGYFHSTSSDNVGLVLSAINERNERVQGFVTLTELFGHRFNNELVVISGCDTAMGMQLAGEGMMGVTRGFLAQGAQHVVSTLWPVSDRASAQFMALFYKNLRGAGGVAEALRAAQRDLKALPEFRHPYYWAAYVLTTVSKVDTMRFDGELALSQ